MRILFISKNLVAGNLAYLLKKEGNEVRLFIENKNSRENFENMVEKTLNWRSELSWVGRDGLIVFDDVGYGKVQDRLRKDGYKVFGGSYWGDRLELDREYGQEVFKEVGMKTVTLRDFDNIDDAINYIKSNPAPWVVKANDHDKKYVNYVGELEDGRDVISILNNYLKNKNFYKGNISLHKRVYGVEIGVARYFNGKDFVGPIEFNVEHTKFFPGDLGPTTSEMGTIAWYSEDYENRLYKETLFKMKDYLIRSKFVGDFDINCIVNKDGVYPLEATSRFGSPIVHLHSEMNNTSWLKILYNVACGKDFDFKWKKGYGVVVMITTPPFPYVDNNKLNSSYGVDVHFNKFSKKDFNKIHFEEVALRPGTSDKYYISDNQGYIMFVTSIGKTVNEARKSVYKIIKKIIIPKMFYRNDIGVDFDRYGLPALKKLGYL